MTHPRRRIVGLLVALAGAVTLGLLSRLRPVGWPLYDRSLGDVLYAVVVYLILALMLFRGRTSRLALLALALCLAIELFQATGIPARYAHGERSAGCWARPSPGMTSDAMW